jgi:hypothetical protein
MASSLVTAAAIAIAIATATKISDQGSKNFDGKSLFNAIFNKQKTLRTYGGMKRSNEDWNGRKVRAHSQAAISSEKRRKTFSFETPLVVRPAARDTTSPRSTLLSTSLADGGAARRIAAR